MDDIESIYRNIAKMTDKNFKAYKITLSKELALESKRDLFENNELDRFIDIRKNMRCMEIADIGEQ